MHSSLRELSDAAGKSTMDDNVGLSKGVMTLQNRQSEYAIAFGIAGEDVTSLHSCREP